MNKVIVRGNIVKDITLETSATGVNYVKNTIAVRRDFKNANGETESDFINFIIYKTEAAFLSQFGHKGSNVILEGSWRTGSYKKADGSMVYTNDLYVDRVELLDKKEQEQESKPVPKPKQTFEEELADSKPTQEYDVDADDLPF